MRSVVPVVLGSIVSISSLLISTLTVAVVPIAMDDRFEALFDLSTLVLIVALLMLSRPCLAVLGMCCCNDDFVMIMTC
jgi:membrane-associated HD superfamily phosphohydrolase